MYIYKITNLINNKIYIGQTLNIKRRFNEHKSHLKYNRHTNPELQLDYNIYGLQNFKFEIIEECENNIVLERETYWINYYGGIESIFTYNRSSLEGHNKVYKRNQAAAQLNIHYISVEGKAKISKAHKNKNLSIEHINKIKENAKINPNFGMRNKHHNKESKIKMSKAKKNMFIGSNNPNYKYTPEFINNLKEEYKSIKNYNELSRKYNINQNTISRLIRFGKS